MAFTGIFLLNVVPSSAQAQPPNGPLLMHNITVQNLSLVPLEPGLAEDGHGQRVAASRPIALDIRAEQWPVRALDPVLFIDSLQFKVYTHPAPGVLRFQLADRALVQGGANAWIQYGDDTRSRVELTALLEEAQR